MNEAPTSRSAAWKWWVCGLLLLATAINYMDRQTLANAAVRIANEFHLSKEQYGGFEVYFGWAFAVGSLLFGFIADRVSVRWLYPAVLFAWSLMGFLSARTTDFKELLACRTSLGFFEAGHWPCALKTTRLLLSPQDRTMGNSVLQSGASVGAIITPLVMRAMMTNAPGSWRLPFQVIGAVGIVWVVMWLLSVRPRELRRYDGVGQPLPPHPEGIGARTSVRSNGRAEEALEPRQKQSNVRGLLRTEVRAPAVLPGEDGSAGAGTPWSAVFSRRFVATLIVIFCIQMTWQLLRVWLPMFLQLGRGYSEKDALLFNSVYFVATDIGCITAGAVSLWLARRGLSPHAAQCRVYLFCSLLTALTVLVAVLPKSWLLLATLLLVGAGALGVYPCFYSFVQEISPQHVGKIYGLLATLVWAISSPVHKYFGRYVDQTQSFDLGIAVVGLTPLVGYLALWLFWGNPKLRVRSLTLK
jgi:ACS family hexuronate transporter-like MFS transporter